jgi:hypothetical protein
MGKMFVFILLTIVVYSCTNKPVEQDVSLLYSQITVNDRFKELLQQFVRENPCANCMNKVFIDKVYEVGSVDYKNIITIQQMPFSKGDYQRLNPSPILKIRIDSSIFYLYSGVESFLKVRVDSIKSVRSSTNGNFVNWTVIDQKDTLVINRRGVPPFSPFSMPSSKKINE